ncbi:MAG: hypothetical protein AAF266_07940 [Planctomycetota bacterium]
MKKTIDIPDALYPRVEAASAAAGLSVEAFVVASLEKQAPVGNGKPVDELQRWWDSIEPVSPDLVAEVQSVIDEEFSRIDPKDWQ